MHTKLRWTHRCKLAALSGLGFGVLMQFGACNIGQVSVPTTLDARELIITLIRGALLTPIDQAITSAVRGAFGNDDDE